MLFFTLKPEYHTDQGHENAQAECADCLRLVYQINEPHSDIYHVTIENSDNYVIDYVYGQNAIDAAPSDSMVWFQHNDTSLAPRYIKIIELMPGSVAWHLMMNHPKAMSDADLESTGLLTAQEEN